jgi:hypothetical protein
LSTTIQTEEPINDITIDFIDVPSGVTTIVVTQSIGEETLVMGMETARKLAFVLIGMTNQWRRENPSS